MWWEICLRQQNPMNKLPLISVICPTHSGREKHLEMLLAYFHAQDYAHKELIIVTDDLRMSIDHEEKGSRVHYVNNGYTVIKPVGTKRNIACAHAYGEIIVQFDSDDIFLPDYITTAYNHLIASGADMTGLNNMYFYRPHTAMYEYQYQGKQPYVCGSGAMYYKEVWKRNKFDDINRGEDKNFCINAGKISPHNRKELMLAMLHSGNTDSHNAITQFKKVEPSLAKTILGSNFKKYPL